MAARTLPGGPAAPAIRAAIDAATDRLATDRLAIDAAEDAIARAAADRDTRIDRLLAETTD